MAEHVPLQDPDLDSTQSSLTDELAQAELRALSAESALKEVLATEKSQSILLRWSALGLGGVVSLVMVVFLWCSATWLFNQTEPPLEATTVAALTVPPILSLTAVSLGILAAVFGRMTRKDLDRIESGASGLAGILRG